MERDYFVDRLFSKVAVLEEGIDPNSRGGLEQVGQIQRAYFFAKRRGISVCGALDELRFLQVE